MQHIYIIGSKGIPAKYGGFETFVENLTKNRESKKIQYHVACLNSGDNLYGEGKKHFEYNHADCFNIDVPNVGAAKAIYYDIKALSYAIEMSKKNEDVQPIFYILACRIGPFIGLLKKRIDSIGGRLYTNPDGHEWLREKWSYPVRKYWKYSEKLMVKHSDLIICDSLAIENYIKIDYKKYSPKTTYISYGTDIQKSKLDNNNSVVKEWFEKNEIQENKYYLVVGRFVPENNYEAMISEFMKSETTKDLVIITNIEENKFYKKLFEMTHFQNDPRIKFVGTVYDQELLKYIRGQAFAYIHGHEVGGTNPSLLEAMAFTKVNLLLDVEFNREVGRNQALYWRKNQLHVLIKELETSSFSLSGQLIIKKYYTWCKIISDYEKILGG